MISQEALLESVWKDIINAGMDVRWVDAVIKRAARSPDEPFADIGPVLQRMLERGVSREDICRLNRHAAYEACFTLLEMLEGAELDEDALSGIHESILVADPSGKEGRPGSWPIQAGRRATARKGKAKPGPRKPLLTVKRAFSLEFSPDGSAVAASHDGRIWRIADGKELAKCEIGSNVTHIAFSPDGTRLAGLNTSGAIAVCDALNGKRLLRLRMKAEGSGLAFSPDGAALAAGDWDGNLFVWDAASGQVLWAPEFPRAMVHGAGFPAGGGKLTATVQTKWPDQHSFVYTWRWDGSIGMEQSQVEIDKQFERSCFSPTDGALVVAHGGKETHVLSMPSGQLVANLGLAHAKHVAFSPDGQLLAAVVDGKIAFLKTGDWKVVREVNLEDASDVAFSSDGRLVALASWQEGYVWEVGVLLAD